MSQENLELVRARFEAFARTGQLDLDHYDPDVRWHLRADLPDAETLVGHDRLLQFFSEWTEAFGEIRFDVDELIDAGVYVVVVLRIRGRVRESDEEVAMPETRVSHLVDGKVVEQWEYRTKAEALKAVGLEE